MGYHIYTQRQEEMQSKRKRPGMGWVGEGSNAPGRIKTFKVLGGLTFLTHSV